MKKHFNVKSIAVFAMVLGVSLLVTHPAWAAAVDPFSGGLSIVSSWYRGSMAKLLALVALLSGVILSIGGRITSALVAFALALIVGLGDTVVSALATL